MDDKYYKPSDDTFTFIDVLSLDLKFIKKSSIIMEMGCGNGEISKYLKTQCLNSFIISSDINMDALHHTRQGAQTDCLNFCFFDGIRQDHLDIVIFNPPYVETPDEDIGFTDIRASYSGGKCGRTVIMEFISALTDVTLLYLLVIRKNDPLFILQQLILKGYEPKIIKVRKILVETIYIISAKKIVSN